MHLIPLPQALSFMLNNSYLNAFYSPGTFWKRSSDSLLDKLKHMQSFFGLEPNGELNVETFKLMKQPRCGVPDVAGYQFFPQKNRWQAKVLELTIYCLNRVVNYTLDLGWEEVDEAIQKALQLWNDVIPLHFTKISNGTADIMLSFVTKEHGDFFPFDGPLGNLAHAFPPGDDIGGDIHFDDDETWTNDFRGGCLFIYSDAAHEFGHALGLEHSTNPEALMYPLYTFRDLKDIALSEDDVEGIQALYGTPSIYRCDKRPLLIICRS
uniref:Peptidase metallopeptidase domain-containing protein n=1 Tax=Varanus komodoensis TaxID=61221 RepID=A0A8D2JCN2_VARKO